MAALSAGGYRGGEREYGAGCDYLLFLLFL